MPRLPPVIKAIFLDNLFGASFAIESMLYHSWKVINLFVKSYQRLLLFGLLALALTAIISPWAAATWQYITATQAGWQQYRYTFSKIFDRCFMFAGMILFFGCRRFLKLGSLNQLGLTPRTRAGGDFFLGVGLSVASMAGLTLIMALTDVFIPYFRLSLSETMARCGTALLAALGAGFFEEIFFRGIVFKGLREDLGPVRGYFFANLFFAAIHFVRPSDDIVLTGIHPWAGIRHVVYSFYPFLDFGTLFPGLLGLFLIGTVLCYAFERSGTLYLSIGLHAGWIFSLKTFGVFGQYTRESLGWMFGSTDPKVVSGVISWIGIVFVGVLVHRFTRSRLRLLAAPRTATEV